MEAKKIKVQQYVYERVLKNNVEISIPQEPVYIQEEHGHYLTAIFPQKEDWDGGSGNVWEIQIVEVSNTRILRTYIRTDEHTLSDIVSRFEYKGKSSEEHLQDKIVRFLLDNDMEYVTTKAVFENGFERRVKELNDLVKTGNKR